MQRRARRIKCAAAGLALLAACADTEARAWTPELERRVARESARLMPPSLRRILQAHFEEVASGVAEASSGKSGGAPAGAPARVETIAREIQKSINEHRPFAEISRRFGALAHWVCTLQDPLQAADADPRESEYAIDYALYVEGNLGKYPLVFYGWSDDLLDAGDVAGFAEAAVSRARRYYGYISRAYSPGNPVPAVQRFDDRSLPFGIGSLCYSRCVTDTARIWLHIWKSARGDMHGTPYLASSTAPSPQAGTPKARE